VPSEIKQLIRVRRHPLPSCGCEPWAANALDDTCKGSPHPQSEMAVRALPLAATQPSSRHSQRCWAGL